MGKRGPPAKPLEWHKAVGSHHVSERAGEPDTLQIDPVMPEWIADRVEAVAYWNRLRDRLKGIRCWSDQYAETMAVLCATYADYLDAREEAKNHDPVCVSEKGGMYPSPFHTRVRCLYADFMKAAKEFGMTPASKTQLRVDDSQLPAKSDPESEFGVVA